MFYSYCTMPERYTNHDSIVWVSFIRMGKQIEKLV